MFKAEGFKKIADSLKSPPGRVPNLDANAQQGDMIATPRCAMSAKSWLRLEQAVELVRFYGFSGHSLLQTCSGILSLSPSHEHWESLTTQIKDSPLVLLKMTKALPSMKGQEAIKTYLSQVHGTCSIP
jgi:hypothetical protein